MLDSEKNFFVHHSSFVDENCSIGNNTKIWHFSHIMSGSYIGTNCNIGQNVVISPEVIIGDNVKIQNNVSVYTGVKCEDNVFIGPSVVFTNILNPRSSISRKNEFRETLLMEGASIGANATILCGVKIGKFALIGAGSVITKDIKNYSLVYGNPGKHKGWISEHGEKLEFDSNFDAQCKLSKDKYKLINDTVHKI